jgi:hypothetical protein
VCGVLCGWGMCGAAGGCRALCSGGEWLLFVLCVQGLCCVGEECVIQLGVSQARLQKSVCWQRPAQHPNQRCIPACFCCFVRCPAGNSSLLLLNVRGNKLEGNPQGVEECGNLVQLDISQNRFSGRCV